MQILDVGYIFCEINVEQKELKTLFNTMEAPLKKNWSLMPGLYDDVQMDQQTARNTKVLTFMWSLSR